MFNVLSRKTIFEYCKKFPTAENALFDWYREMIKAKFNNFNQLKLTFPDASIIGDNRVVFNILGNEFRLIVRIVFKFKIIQVKWFGPHKDYDRINATLINK